MRHVITAVLLLAVVPVVLAGTVFVSSSPQGARVTVNGAELDQVTPLRIELDTGESAQIEASLPGHLPAEYLLEPERSDVVEIDLTLVPDFVLTGFPEDQSSLRLLADVPRARFVRLPQGTYTIERGEDGVVVTPHYRHDALIGGLSVGAAVGLGTTITSLLTDLEGPDATRLSGATVVSGFATLILLTADIVFLADRARFFSSLEPVVVPVNPLDARLLLDRAEIALEAGSLAFAEESLAEYVRLVPDGDRVAESLYRRARILVSTGEFERALPVYEALIRDYPNAEFYDRGILGLAEAYGRLGRPADGIAALADIVFVRDVPSHEEVDLQRADLYDILSISDPGVSGARVEAWVLLLEGYPDSDDAGYYRLMAADAMIDAERPAEAADLLSGFEPEESLLQLLGAIRRRLLEAGY